MMTSTTTKKSEPTIVYEFVGTGDVPTRVSPGDGTTYLVDDQGRFEAPAKFRQALHYLNFETRGEARLKPNAESRGIGAHMGADRSKRNVSK